VQPGNLSGLLRRDILAGIFSGNGFAEGGFGVGGAGKLDEGAG